MRFGNSSPYREKFCKEYDFQRNDSDDDKKKKISRRKKLLDNYEQDLLFKHIIERYTYLINKKEVQEIKKNEKNKNAIRDVLKIN